FFFFSSSRRHTRCYRDWSSDVCSSDLKDVWLPPGTWYRFDTGEAFVGARWVRINADLATILLFARAGAIVPTARPALHLADVPQIGRASCRARGPSSLVGRCIGRRNTD